MRDEFWDTAPHYGGQKGADSPRYWVCLLDNFGQKGADSHVNEFIC